MDIQKWYEDILVILGFTIFQLGASQITVGTILFLVTSFGLFIYASKLLQKRLIEPFLEKRKLKDTLIEKLAFLVHVFVFIVLGTVIVDRSALNITGLQIIQSIQKIMSEPLIPLGKAKITLWSLSYIAVLSTFLIVGTGRIQQWVVDNVFNQIKIDVGSKYGISMIAKYVILILGFLVILQSAGIDLSTLTIMAGALGLGLSFGLQSIVANFVSGFTILIERPIKVGDRVEIDGVLGNITKIKLRSTTVMTNDRIEIIIPNSDFITRKVTNLSHSSKDVRFNFHIGVSYNSDPKLVKRILESVAIRHPGVLSKPPPLLVFTGFGESSIDFELRVWTRKYLNKPDILQSELFYEIFDELRSEGIEIPFPQRDLHLKSGCDSRIAAMI